MHVAGEKALVLEYGLALGGQPENDQDRFELLHCNPAQRKKRSTVC